VTSIAILGLGPRGLNVLERITAYVCNGYSSQPIHLHLIEPGVPGVGIHYDDQPDYLLLNTVASQITMFMDPTVKDAGPLLPGPNMYEWAAGLDDPRYNQCTPNCYLPRRLFGEYLHWVYQYLCRRLDRFCKVTLHKTSAKDVIHKPDQTFSILCDDQTEIDADFLFMATGHSENYPDERDRARIQFVENNRFRNRYLQYVMPGPAPIHTHFKDVPPGATVAIEGMGLTAIDAIASLTVGRGGRFHRNAETGDLCYKPSGDEPCLAIISRSGLPLSCRAINQKGASDQYQARFLTADQVRHWKMTKNRGELDFFNDVFPLLLKDMQYVFYTTQATKLYGNSYAHLLGEMLVHLGAEATENLIVNDCPGIELFRWENIANPIDDSALGDPDAYRKWLISFLEQDLHEAQLGNVSGPYKAACDVLRDVRDNLRNAVDFGWLSPESHQQFLRRFIPVMNRLAVGPPVQRLEEMIALYKAGYLDIGFGPNPKVALSEGAAQFQIVSTTFKEQQKSIYADVLCKAQIPKSSPTQDRSALIQNLMKRGLIRPFTNGNVDVGGIEVDDQLNLVTSSGESVPNAWALGTVSEGSKFYTYIVPRPCVNSTALVDAGRSVTTIFRQNLRPPLSEQDHEPGKLSAMGA